MARTARDVTPEEMEVYRATLRRREARLQAHLAARTERAWDVARDVAKMLRERYGATRVVLYGSLARGTFSLGSDVDLIAWGISMADWTAALADALDLGADIETNVVLAQHATARLLADVQRDGVPLG